MRIGKWARLLLVAAPLLAGCKGFWDAPTTPPAPTTLSSGNFYILTKGSTTSQIYGFSIVSGTLTALSGSPYTVTGLANSMAMDSTGSFVYVSTTVGIFLYTVDSSSGALTQSGQSISGDTTGVALAVSADGNWLVEASATGVLNAIPLTSSGTVDTSGTLQTVALATDAQVQPGEMAISTNTPLAAIAVAEGSVGTQIFPITSAAATNPIGKALPTIAAKGTASIAVAWDPQNRLLYVGETADFPSSTSSSGGLRALTLTATSTTLTLAELSGSPYASGGTGPHAITSNASGDYVYVASWQGTSAGLVTPFQVTTSGTTYLLTAETNTTATGDEPFGLVEDSEGNFMLAVNYLGSPTLNGFIFDTTTTYQLDSAVSDTSVASPIAIIAAP